jgi:hypothetical protein
MRLPRMSTRGWMIAVGLIGLNLAAAIATSKCYPRPTPYLPVGYGGGGWYIQYSAEGRVEEGEVNLETGYKRRTRVWRLPPRPTLLQIWFPVIAGVGISLLTLGVAWRRFDLQGRTG